MYKQLKLLPGLLAIVVGVQFLPSGTMLAANKPPILAPNKPPSKGKHTVIDMQTNKGLIVMEMHDDDAPNTVANFVKLVNKKFYNGLTFHRYVEGFVIQGGDPQGTGEGGPGYSIKLEIGKMKHLKGTVAMARTSDPNSAGSQFYICLADIPHLDGQYATFAHVTKGIDVVMKLRQGDKMTKVWVEK